MTTVRELLEDAAGEPAHPLDLERVHERGRSLSRRRSVTRLAIPAVVVIVLVAAMLIVARPGDEGAVASFDVPPIGSAVGEYLDDGTPVWVVHALDGEVYVVGAENPEGVTDDDGSEAPFNHAWAVAWCPTSHRFESLWGSQWDPDGARFGGPTPFGLPRYNVTHEGGVVTVTPEDPDPQLQFHSGLAQSDSLFVSECWMQPPAELHPEWRDLRVTRPLSP